MSLLKPPRLLQSILLTGSRITGSQAEAPRSQHHIPCAGTGRQQRHPLGATHTTKSEKSLEPHPRAITVINKATELQLLPLGWGPHCWPHLPWATRLGFSDSFTLTDFKYRNFPLSLSVDWCLEWFNSLGEAPRRRRWLLWVDKEKNSQTKIALSGKPSE